ncbi:hypothetical protein M885DRAFT_519447 [Pelagophyceae sp. CCMP2097]|nr:hypothetical protein M885DRAFT_519447 [Pelagophyceae sp. CCMP2097]
MEVGAAPSEGQFALRWGAELSAAVLGPHELLESMEDQLSFLDRICATGGDGDGGDGPGTSSASRSRSSSLAGGDVDRSALWTAAFALPPFDDLANETDAAKRRAGLSALELRRESCLRDVDDVRATRDALAEDVDASAGALHARKAEVASLEAKVKTTQKRATLARAARDAAIGANYVLRSQLEEAKAAVHQKEAHKQSVYEFTDAQIQRLLVEQKAEAALLKQLETSCAIFKLELAQTQERADFIRYTLNRAREQAAVGEKAGKGWLKRLFKPKA